MPPPSLFQNLSSRHPLTMPSPIPGPIPRALNDTILWDPIYSANHSDPQDAAANPFSSLHDGSGSEEHAHEEMFKVVTEVSVVHLTYTLLSAFTVTFGMFSSLVKERLYAGEPIVATGMGIIFSDYVADIFSPRRWTGGTHFDEITLELTRVVIALSVFAVGVELPKSYVLKHWKSLFILLGPNMIYGWVVSAGLVVAIIPKLTFLQSLVVAAGLTPTDPVLAASVVGKGKFAQEHVPAHLRHLLQCESGSNDGAAFPFLFLALFLLLREDSSLGSTIGHWIYLVILYQIILGVFIGAVVGILARKVMKFSKRKKLIDRESMVAMYIALALFVTGVTTLAGSDDLLAAFACGAAFAWDDWFSESIEDSNFSNIIDLLINCYIFVYIGATMPFAAWTDEALSLSVWRLVLLAIGILVLRRMPMVLLMYKFVPDIKTFREAVFSGHFGPMGVGAIFISTLAVSKLPTPTYPPETSLDTLTLSLQPITYFLVLSSVLIHGLTIPFFSLSKGLHSRIYSLSRTWTQASGNEPSWLGRIKRADRTSDIVINQDDKDEKSSLTPTSDSEKENGNGESDPEKRALNVPEAIKEEEEDHEDVDETEMEEDKGSLKDKNEAETPSLSAQDNSDIPTPSPGTTTETPGGLTLTTPPDPRAKPTTPELERANDQNGRGSPAPSTSSSRGKTGEAIEPPKTPPRSRRPSAAGQIPVGAARYLTGLGDFGKWVAPLWKFGDDEIQDPAQRAIDALARKERRDCRAGEERQWIEGDTVIIERNGGDDVEVRPLSTAEKARIAQATARAEVARERREEQEREQATADVADGESGLPVSGESDGKGPNGQRQPVRRASLGQLWVKSRGKEGLAEEGRLGSGAAGEKGSSAFGVGGFRTGRRLSETDSQAKRPNKMMLGGPRRLGSDMKIGPKKREDLGSKDKNKKQIEEQENDGVGTSSNVFVEGNPMPSPSKLDESPVAENEFLEGNKVVSESKDGEDVHVRELSPEESKEINQRRHKGWNEAIRKPVEAIEQGEADMEEAVDTEGDLIHDRVLDGFHHLYPHWHHHDGGEKGKEKETDKRTKASVKQPSPQPSAFSSNSNSDSNTPQESTVSKDEPSFPSSAQPPATNGGETVSSRPANTTSPRGLSLRHHLLRLSPTRKAKAEADNRSNSSRRPQSPEDVSEPLSSEQERGRMMSATNSGAPRSPSPTRSIRSIRFAEGSDAEGKRNSKRFESGPGRNGSAPTTPVPTTPGADKISFDLPPQKPK